MSLLVADSALRIHCVNGTCYVHHPLKQKSFDCKILENKPLKKLMNYLEKPKSKSDVHAFIAVMLNVTHENAAEAATELKKNGFIKEIESQGISLSWEKHNWREAGILHEHTINTPRILYNNKMGNIYDVALMKHYVKETPPPANHKEYEGTKIQLEKPDVDESITLDSMLRGSKKPEILTFKKLSRLLYYAFGKIGDRHMQVTGKHMRKTVPSGGARHPYEFYLLVHDIEGLDPGIYHYQFNDHHLTVLQLRNASLVASLIDQYLVIDPKRLCFSPQIAIIYSCMFERSMHRYRYSRSYRVMQYDLGHIYQNLEFLAKSYSLNIYAGYSCHEQKIEQAIGIDSITESCMGYAVL